MIMLRRYNISNVDSPVLLTSYTYYGIAFQLLHGRKAIEFHFERLQIFLLAEEDAYEISVSWEGCLWRSNKNPKKNYIALLNDSGVYNALSILTGNGENDDVVNVTARW